MSEARIETGMLLLLFRGGTGQQAFMPADQLTACGTPSGDDGVDLEYVGWTTDVATATAFVRGPDPDDGRCEHNVHTFDARRGVRCEDCGETL